MGDTLIDLTGWFVLVEEGEVKRGTKNPGENLRDLAWAGHTLVKLRGRRIRPKCRQSIKSPLSWDPRAPGWT